MTSELLHQKILECCASSFRDGPHLGHDSSADCTPPKTPKRFALKTNTSIHIARTLNAIGPSFHPSPFDSLNAPAPPTSEVPAATVQNITKVLQNATNNFQEAGYNATATLQELGRNTSVMLANVTDHLVQRIISAATNASLIIHQQGQDLLQNFISTSQNATLFALQQQDAQAQGYAANAIAPASGPTLDQQVDQIAQLSAATSETTSAVYDLQSTINSTIGVLVQQNQNAVQTLLNASMSAARAATAAQNTTESVVKAAYNATLSAFQESGSQLINQLVNSSLTNSSDLIGPNSPFAQQLNESLMSATASSLKHIEGSLTATSAQLQSQAGTLVQNATNAAFNATLSNLTSQQQGFIQQFNATAFSSPIADLAQNVDSVLTGVTNIVDLGSSITDLLSNSTLDLLGNVTSAQDLQNRLVDSWRLNVMIALAAVFLTGGFGLHAYGQYLPTDHARRAAYIFFGFASAAFGLSQLFARLIVGTPTLGNFT